MRDRGVAGRRDPRAPGSAGAYHLGKYESLDVLVPSFRITEVCVSLSLHCPVWLPLHRMGIVFRALGLENSTEVPAPEVQDWI
jgi:hypothetical protein